MNNPPTDFFSSDEGAYVFYTLVTSENKGSVYKVLCLVNKHIYKFLRGVIGDCYKRFGNVGIHLIEKCGVGKMLCDRPMITQLFVIRSIPFYYVERVLIEYITNNINKPNNFDIIIQFITYREDITMEFIKLNMDCINPYGDVNCGYLSDVDYSFFMKTHPKIMYTPSFVLSNPKITTPSTLESVLMHISTPKSSILKYVSMNNSFRPQDVENLVGRVKKNEHKIFDNFIKRGLDDEGWNYVLSHNLSIYYVFCAGEHNGCNIQTLLNLIDNKKLSVCTLSNKLLFNETTITGDVLKSLTENQGRFFRYVTTLSKEFFIRTKNEVEWHSSYFPRYFTFQSLRDYCLFVECVCRKSTAEYCIKINILDYLSCGGFTITDIEFALECGLTPIQLFAGL